jgi:predicted RNA-binding Zn-ribbon protein involved in translation (DUF1610 family)
MIDKEKGPNETVCPHCGAEARWRVLDTAQKVVEMECPDCGRFEMPESEFRQATTETVETGEAE